jgi:hypothetical protein
MASMICSFPHLEVVEQNPGPLGSLEEQFEVVVPTRRQAKLSSESQGFSRTLG